jgi:signal peptidase II
MMYFIIAALIVLLDQLSKYFLTMKLSGGEIVRLLPGLVRMEYVRNTGAAFSFLSDMRWVLVGVSTVVIVAIAVGLVRYRNKIDLVGKLSLAFILGGAFSNLIDRALFGYVSDFFEFEFVRFAVFNVADIFITVGGVAFCLWYLFNGSKRDSLRDEFMLVKRRKAGPEAENTKEKDSGGPDQT